MYKINFLNQSQCLISMEELTKAEKYQVLLTMTDFHFSLITSDWWFDQKKKITSRLLLLSSVEVSSNDNCFPVSKNLNRKQAFPLLD